MNTLTKTFRHVRVYFTLISPLFLSYQMLYDSITYAAYIVLISSALQTSLIRRLEMITSQQCRQQGTGLFFLFLFCVVFVVSNLRSTHLYM